MEAAFGSVMFVGTAMHDAVSPDDFIVSEGQGDAVSSTDAPSYQAIAS
jgi:hypothetical protein